MDSTSTLDLSLPPQNLDAERALLGCLMLDWGLMTDTIAVLRADRFYSFQNKTIYEAMEKLYTDNIRGDVITVVDALEKGKLIEQAGGLPYITSLSNFVPTSANINYYIDIVLDRATRRDVLSASRAMQVSAFDMSHKSDVVLEESEQMVFALSDKNARTEIFEFPKVIEGAIEVIEKSIGTARVLTGIPSGITRLDNMTQGFQNSEMIIIGARPSIGKTAFALSMMQHIAIEKKIKCGFFSLEMSRQSIAHRFLSQMTQIPSGRIRSSVTKDEFRALKEASGRCFSAPLYIVDTPNIQLLDLRSMARRMKLNDDVKIIFIDYIGLIATQHPDAPVYEAQSEISKSLKSLARELNIPIVVLCQVARDAEGKEPTLAQLRGSGSIEQDADVVIFLHRERDSQADLTDSEGQDAKCIIAKQRNGATGTVEMRFFPRWTKFENIASGV